MTPSDIETLAIKLAALTQQLEQRSERAVQRLEATGVAMEQRAQQLFGEGAQFAQDALRVIGTQAQQVIASNVGQSAAQLNGQLHDSARAAQQAAQGLQAQQSLLTRAQTALVWKGLIALIMGSTLAVLGSGYFAWQSMQQLQQAKFGQDVLRATQNGALTHCDDSLCARVGKRPQRYGNDGDYALLQ